MAPAPPRNEGPMRTPGAGASIKTGRSAAGRDGRLPVPSVRSRRWIDAKAPGPEILENQRHSTASWEMDPGVRRHIS